MAFPVLPPKYYLTHFFEFIDFLETHYLPVMQPSQVQFLSDFRALSENAQCVFVRMLNRKGAIFNQDLFQKYSEIENPHQFLQELIDKNFVGPLGEQHKKEILTFLTKGELRKWFTKNDLASAASLSRDELVELGRRHLDQLSIAKLDSADMLVVQKRTDEVEYLLFLYFGQIQKSLNLYTLRDLGIRKSNTLKDQFKPRFANSLEAEAEFFFAKQLDQFHELESLDDYKALFSASQKLSDLRSSAQILKNELLLQIADQVLENDCELALSAFFESRHPEAREKAARYLYKAGRKDESRMMAEQILEDPRSDVELLFAEDFLARKFDKKKMGYLTEILKNSEEMVLSDFYLKQPEKGVRDFYRAQGQAAHFTENHLWLGLFGVLFWEELFESETASIHNPFERSPTDLVGPDFYNKNKESLEAKLDLLKSKDASIHFLKSLTKHYGKLNDIFQWHPNLTKTVLEFLKHSTNQDVASVLRAMAQKFDSHHSGFPDLMVEKDGVLRFIEVKAEGDALRAGQLSKIRLLRDAGFDVDVLRVRWKSDPNQIYVVVDVETTGGTSGTHRVTEIGAVKIQNGLVIDEFQTLINPERMIPAFITQITGITNEMVADAPRFSEIAERFMQFMEGAIFVAHNVKFDYGFIQREFARADMEFVRPHLCTCSGMRKAYPGIESYSLKNLTEHFQIALKTHHRALHDARAAAELLLLMNSKRTAELSF